MTPEEIARLRKTYPLWSKDGLVAQLHRTLDALEAAQRRAETAEENVRLVKARLARLEEQA